METGAWGAEILAYIAGGLFAIGYLMINQVHLRIMVLLGTFFYIWYYTVATESPLWPAIYMSTLMGTANLLGLAQIFAMQSKWTLPRAYRDLYPRFNALLPGDFRALMQLAHRETVPKGTVITVQGEPVSHLHYVISGALLAEKNDERFGLPSGIFIGEVAFVINQASSASTWAGSDIEVLRWDFVDLKRKSARNARFKLALEATLTRDLAVKVAYAVAPHNAIHNEPAFPSPDASGRTDTSTMRGG